MLRGVLFIPYFFFEAGKDGQEFFDFTGFKFRAPKALEHKAARWVLAVGSSEKTCFSRRIQGEFNLLSELWYEMASSNSLLLMGACTCSAHVLFFFVVSLWLLSLASRYIRITFTERLVGMAKRWVRRGNWNLANFKIIRGYAEKR